MSFVEDSRKLYSRKTGKPSTITLIVGCLQRIALAMELANLDTAKLAIKSNKLEEEQYGLIKAGEKLLNENKSLKCQLTKLKNQLNKSHKKVK